jgi:monofunctional biosynthetic peptidoglycan transglycosylase
MVKRLLRWTLAAAAVGFAGAAYVYLSLPDVRPLRKENPRTTAFMELRAREADKAGKKPRKVQQWVGYERISPSLKRAVIVAEDAAFFSHEGVDLDELEKSFEDSWKKGTRMRGGSTITQQLAKNLYLSPSRNPLRKVKEAVTAWRLESALGKERILELYLNVVEFGPEVWGVEAASQAYFRRPARRLRDDQAALLAATLPSPLRANPGLRASRLRWRQQLILRRMAGESIILPPPEEEPPEAPTTEQLPPPTASADSLAASPDTAAQR